MSSVIARIETSSWIVIVAGLGALAAGFFLAPAGTRLLALAFTGASGLIGFGAYAAWATATWGQRHAVASSVFALLVGIYVMVYPWLVSALPSYVYAVSATGLVAVAASAYELRLATRVSRVAPRVAI